MGTQGPCEGWRVDGATTWGRQGVGNNFREHPVGKAGDTAENQGGDALIVFLGGGGGELVEITSGARHASLSPLPPCLYRPLPSPKRSFASLRPLPTTSSFPARDCISIDQLRRHLYPPNASCQRAKVPIARNLCEQPHKSRKAKQRPASRLLPSPGLPLPLPRPPCRLRTFLCRLPAATNSCSSSMPAAAVFKNNRRASARVKPPAGAPSLHQGWAMGQSHVPPPMLGPSSRYRPTTPSGSAWGWPQDGWRTTAHTSGSH